MHVLTTGHGAHGVDAGAHVVGQSSPDPGPGAARTVTSDGEQLVTDHAGRGHVHPGDHAAPIEVPSTNRSSMLGATTPGGAAPADAGHLVAAHVVASVPACDTDCSSSLEAVCLAVLVLVLLLLGRRAGISGRVPASRASLSSLVPALGVGPRRPSLVQLCVSRT